MVSNKTAKFAKCFQKNDKFENCFEQNRQILEMLSNKCQIRKWFRTKTPNSLNAFKKCKIWKWFRTKPPNSLNALKKYQIRKWFRNEVPDSLSASGIWNLQTRRFIKDWNLGQSRILESNTGEGGHGSGSFLNPQKSIRGVGGEVFYKPEVAIKKWHGGGLCAQRTG